MIDSEQIFLPSIQKNSILSKAKKFHFQKVKHFFKKIDKKDNLRAVKFSAQKQHFPHLAGGTGFESRTLLLRILSTIRMSSPWSSAPRCCKVEKQCLKKTGGLLVLEK